LWQVSVFVPVSCS
jgi:hypothetical protein